MLELEVRRALAVACATVSALQGLLDSTGRLEMLDLTPVGPGGGTPTGPPPGTPEQQAVEGIVERGLGHQGGTDGAGDPATARRVPNKQWRRGVLDGAARDRSRSPWVNPRGARASGPVLF